MSFNKNLVIKLVLCVALVSAGLCFGLVSNTLAVSPPKVPIGPYAQSQPIHFEPQYLCSEYSRVQVAFDDPSDEWSYKKDISKVIVNGNETKIVDSSLHAWWPYVENLNLNSHYTISVKACAYRDNFDPLGSQSGSLCDQNCNSTDPNNAVCRWTDAATVGREVYTPPQIPNVSQYQNLTQDGVNLYWTPSAGATVYNVKIWKSHINYRTGSSQCMDTAPWPTLYLQGVSSGIRVSGLEPNTEYTWSVQSGHNNDYFDVSNTQWVNRISWNALLRQANTGYFTTTGVPVKYACNTSGACVQDPSGSYTVSNCNNQCQAPARYACNTSGSCVSDPNGTYTTSNCNNQCQAPVRYSCNTNGSCVQDSNGTYPDSTCNYQCHAPITHYSCSSSGSCVQDSAGQYTTSNCDNQCQAPIRYDCNTSGSCVQTPGGSYTNSNCNNQCHAPVKYACNTSGSCVSDPNGTYPDATCNYTCHAPVRYDCNASGSCVQTPGGYYTSSDCNGQCHAPVRYSCNSSTWSCYANTYGPYSNYYDCQNNCQQSIQPPTVDINAYPPSITSGQSSLLSWYSNNATSCTASYGWSGTKALSGNEYTYPSQTTTYTITCYGPGGSATDSTTVSVSNVITNGLSITKLGRNLSAGNQYYDKTVYGAAGDILEFYIRVANIGAINLNNVVVIDNLPAGLSYVSGTTKIDNILYPDGIITSGLSLGTFAPGTAKLITFQAKILSNAPYSAITNTANINAANTTAVSDNCTVIRREILGASTVATGPTESLMLALAISLAMTGLIWYYLRINPKGKMLLARIKESKAERQLRQIRKSEI